MEDVCHNAWIWHSAVSADTIGINVLIEYLHNSAMVDRLGRRSYQKMTCNGMLILLALLLLLLLLVKLS